METVKFRQMKDGGVEDYQLLDQCEREFAAGTADRVLAALAALEGSMSGYQVSRLEHSLQTAMSGSNIAISPIMMPAAIFAIPGTRPPLIPITTAYPWNISHH